VVCHGISERSLSSSSVAALPDSPDRATARTWFTVVWALEYGPPISPTGAAPELGALRRRTAWRASVRLGCRGRGRHRVTTRST
jgi:hypothetical protein